MNDPILWVLPFIGLTGGFLSGLLGLGGGVVLLPLLIGAGKVPLKLAVGTTLVQVIIAAATGMIGHYRGGMVDLKVGLVLGIAGIAGGLTGSILTVYLSAQILEFIFLIVIGIAILLILISQKLYDMDPPRGNFNKILGSSIGFGVGSLTGLLGVGGGFLIIPLMNYFLHVPLRIAIGTSLLIILISSLGTLIVKYQIGHIHLPITSLVISGSVIGALLGVFVSRRTPVKFLRMTFLTALAVIFITTGYKVFF
jgi:uncharacterized protein